MSKPDTRKSDSTKLRRAIGRTLAQGGFTDVHVLGRESGRELLTERRLELIDHLNQREPESITSLADELDRDKKQVSEDLTLLVDKDIIEYEQNGKRKIPKLKHEHVIVEPLY